MNTLIILTFTNIIITKMKLAFNEKEKYIFIRNANKNRLTFLRSETIFICVLNLTTVHHQM